MDKGIELMTADVYFSFYGQWSNIPKLIEALSEDGSSGQHIEASNVDPSAGAANFPNPVYIA